VARWVRKGANGMPVFAGTLSDAQITSVSRYVARHSGGR
jgi:mono/diheme cytochrome c family protein